jgi:DNA modification methylase
VAGKHEILVPKAVLQAVVNQDKVDEPPHSFYKYPARFSPAFARAVIEAYSTVGDTVVDPFCGGGTSLVEAILAGRRAAGFDISSLAVFLARAKMTPLSVHDKSVVTEWAKVIGSIEKPVGEDAAAVTDEEKHYQRNLPGAAKAFFETVIDLARFLPKERQQRFVRLVLLAVGQRALDCKTQAPLWSTLRSEFCARIGGVLEDHYAFLGRAAIANKLPRCRLTETRRVINRSSEESDHDGRIPSRWLPAKLVLTSPPYPGVHVVYHRWQINGRTETPAPFWLANSRDGAGGNYYCLGSRKEPGLKTYFDRLGKAFSSVRGLVGPDSVVVQLVAFSRPESQLPAYLQRMEEAGFVELKPICDDDYLINGRIWRQVPGRKWYAKNRGEIPASKEVMLLHRAVDEGG